MPHLLHNEIRFKSTIGTLLHPIDLSGPVAHSSVLPCGVPRPLMGALPVYQQ